MARTNSSETEYYHTDYLGSVRAITDVNGTIPPGWSRDYYPFGSDKDASGNSNGYKFTGKEWDYESDLYYSWKRYYDPAIGAFISVDPLWEKYPSLSPYQYCANNPLVYVDPDGKEITNPQGMVLSNPQVLMLMVALDNEICQQSGLKTEEFTIEITGGDRYKGSNGNIYSRSNDEVIKESSKTSAHLEKRGARAVDLSIKKGSITNKDIKKAAIKLGIHSKQIKDNYKKDNHIHLALPWGYGNQVKDWFIELFKPFHKDEVTDELNKNNE